MALLRRANPMPLAHVPPVSEMLEATAALERIVATPPRPAFGDRLGDRVAAPPVRRPRRRRLVAALTAMATITAGAAAYAVATRDVTKSLDVSCFASADLRSRRAVVSSAGGDPVVACQNVWRDGQLGPPQPPPPLAACVLGSGAVGVFPSDQAGSTCAKLLLSDVPATTVAPRPAAGTPTQLRDRLTADALEQPCLSPEDAVARAHAEIGRLRLAGWTVERMVQGPFPADRPCASYGFDEEQRRVRIVPSTARRGTG